MSGPRVVYLSERPFPAPGADTEQVVMTVAALHAAGQEIELWIPSDRLGREGASAPRAERLRRHYGIAGGLPVRTLPAVPRRAMEREFARMDGLLQVLPALSFLTGALPALRRASPDLVHVRTPASLVTALASGLPVVHEVYRDDLPRPLVWLLRRCRAVVAHSHVAARALVQRGIDPGRVHVIHNGWYETAPARLSRAEARGRIGLTGAGCVVLYAGSCRPDKGVDHLVGLAAAVPEVTLVLVGASAEDQARLEQRARAAGARSVVVRRRIAPAEVDGVLAAADVLVIPQADRGPDGRVRTLLPIKTFRYLAAGRAILAARTPDLEEVLEHERTALLFDPADRQHAIGCLSRLARDPALREGLAAAALAESARHTLGARAARLRALYASLTDRSAAW